MKKIRALYRLLDMAVSTAFHIGRILALTAWKGEDVDRSMRIRQQWLDGLLPRLGVRVQVSGEPPDFPCLLMANHRSYLDPVVIVHRVLAFPVAKAEVAEWPIIGYGARLTGVLFVKRESRESRKNTLHMIGEKLRDGHQVLLFPEGTSGAQPLTQPFRPGGFEVAAAAGIPVVPVAVHYREPRDHWVGDDTFIRHFLERFGEREMHMALHFGPTVPPSTGPQMMATTQGWIDHTLNNIHQQSSNSDARV
ncbi:MAG TPA: lysophospholipid acyltransferase family protein [Saprospiraceae bacterium]|nr:lysophospholipid acyltransferase family protein [Saprospiraceae bacterium]HND89113.1 lysophospholipid acyltransferase family protein [Saprospiraceae bacterium]HNG88913.1 lysophospholipid acyltransferase family protein [Saprospiraceae bacterium]